MIALDDLAQLNYFLPEEEILEDLRIINKVSSKPVNRKAVTQNLPLTSCTDNMYEARIDDGRLYFDKRWSVVKKFLFGLFFFSFGNFPILFIFILIIGLVILLFSSIQSCNNQRQLHQFIIMCYVISKFATRWLNFFPCCLS